MIEYGEPVEVTVNVDYVYIYPRNGNFSNCESLDELPSGLSIVPENCTILGFVSNQIVMKQFQVVSHDGYDDVFGSFVLSASDCIYNSFEIVRTYGIANIDFEVFDVVDAYTNEVFVNVTMKTPKKSSSVVSYRFCSPSSVLKISLRSISYENWYKGSKLEVFSFVSMDGSRDRLFSGRIDSLAGLDQTHYVSVEYLVSPSTDWYYHFNDFPADWESSPSIEGWKLGSVFPESDNQIQLYKKFFSLSSITNSSSMILSLRHQAGIIVFLNGQEIYRSHLPYGPLTPYTVAVKEYDDNVYHSILLSQHVFLGDHYRSVFVPGVNIIVIAVINTESVPFKPSFDCFLRFTGLSSQYRSFDMKAEIMGFSGKAENIIDIDHESWIDMVEPDIPDASIILNFPAYRKEVISKVVMVNYFHDLLDGPSGFDVYGREEVDDEWVFLMHIESIQWKKTAQNLAFWINTEYPINGLKFTHFSPFENPTVQWRLSEILLFTEQLDRAIPPLSYSDIVQYEKVAILTQFPPSPDYFNFHVTPTLPKGLALDLMDGELSGTPEETVPGSEFVLTATRFDSQHVSVRIKITVNMCYGDNSLYHVNIYNEKHIDNTYWKLYEGFDTQGEELFYSGDLPPQELTSYSFCLTKGYYTLFFMGATTGWHTPGGYSIATNDNHFPFITGAVPWMRNQPNSNVTVVIYTDQQVQPQSSWLLAPLFEKIPPEWKEPSYSVHGWKNIQLSELTHIKSPSFYLRKTIEISSLIEFNSIDFQIQFTGGVIVYLNGYTVFRVNLPESPSQNDYATANHNSTLFSSFSIPLLTGIALEGKNLLAIEYHLARDSNETILSVISQFTVSPIEAIPLSLSSMNGTEPYSGYTGVIENLFDMRSFTTFRPVFVAGTYFEIEFENDARVPFNSYGFLPGNTITDFDYHLEGQIGCTEPWVELDSQIHFNVSDRFLKVMPLPEGYTGWKRLRFVIDTPCVYVFNLMEFMLLTVSPEPAGMCQRDGEYYGVGNQEWSYKRCEKGYSGYKRKQCLNGVWSDEVNECELNILTYIYYPHSFYNLTVGLPYHIEAFMDGVPSLVYSIPSGLKIDGDGTIYGTANQAYHQVYTIIAMNDISAVNTTIELVFHDTYCIWANPFMRVKAGKSVSLSCNAFNKNTVGKYVMKCEYCSSEEGKWIEDDSHCVTVGFIFAIVFILICLIVMIIMLVVKMMRKRANKILSN